MLAIADNPLRRLLAVTLAWVAGFVNVNVLTTSGVTVSHMTGNVTHLGQHLEELPNGFNAALVPALLCVFVASCFVGGAVLSAAVLRGHATPTAVTITGADKPYARALVLEGLLLALASGAGYAWPVGGSVISLYAVIGLSAMAMGLQNAMMTHLSGSIVRTTHLTGVLTDLGSEIVAVFRTPGNAARRFHEPPARRAWLMISIAAMFLLGAICGAAAHRHVPLTGTLVPAGALFLIAIGVRARRAMRRGGNS